MIVWQEHQTIIAWQHKKGTGQGSIATVNRKLTLIFSQQWIKGEQGYALKIFILTHSNRTVRCILVEHSNLL